MTVWSEIGNPIGEARAELARHHLRNEAPNSPGAERAERLLLDMATDAVTTMVVVSRAPLDKIEPFKQRMGWTFPWYSSWGSEFNYDFHVTLDEAVAPAEYNYRTLQPARMTDASGTSFASGKTYLSMKAWRLHKRPFARSTIVLGRARATLTIV